VNATGLRNPAEVESLIARMDVVLTTRLHGTVLALKNGVRAIAIDPIAGGAKIQRQTATIGWPLCINADSLTEEARALARKCAENAQRRVKEIHKAFIAAIRS
jgi:polysaccharide pyruvyl transferase WcaK-like protein